ncbi:MAG TPA: NADH-quinone oxidoreductase subunit L, partial [Dehalococcoidia bacterium]|nr:NADH-quinone oxidoreductase subunit L [Dehalococcoidia bacterium]
WLMPAFTGAAFVILILARNFLPRKGDWIGIFAITGAFTIFWFIAHSYLDNVSNGQFTVFRSGFDWLNVGNFGLRVGFYVDSITVVMLGVVATVAFMVNVYSTGYMHGEARYGLFFAWLALFATSMFTLVLADNFLLLYVCWELVGVCSFLLIGFYYERRSAVEAAKKAFVTTRAGDVGLLIGIILFWRATGTFDIQANIQAAVSHQIGQVYLTVAILFVFLGAMGKSAQVPFHLWLPDAMEGPTPVSALIHAATMVVAGVYLVARTLPIFEAAPGTTTVVLIVGIATALLGATVAIVQTDIKKVIAYSTISNLGFMMAALGAGSVTGGMFHLMTHAFFKACLFLCAGSVIHATGTQEMGQMGGLWKKMPLTFLTFVVAAVANAGIPPFAGFWSKDEVLKGVLDARGSVYVILLLLWVGLSGLYTMRVIILPFFGKPRDQHVYEHAHESPANMTLPLIVLAVLSIIAGFVAFEGVGKAIGLPGGFGQFVFPLGGTGEVLRINAGLAWGATVCALAGFFVALYYWWGRGERAAAVARSFPELYALVVNKFYFDDLYQSIINNVVLGFGRVLAWFDRQIVNDTGVDGTAELTGYTGFRLKFTETGRVPNYALVIGLGVVGLAVLAFATHT